MPHKNRTRYYYVVKLEGDDNSQATAAITRLEAIELLCADPSVSSENRRVMSFRCRASDAGSARLQAGNHQWVWGMLLSVELEGGK